MIDNFKINKFRGIRSLILEDVKQLNLFLGYNNCGKSSVLEALYLFCDPTHPVNEIQINRARHYLKSDNRSLQYLFYNLNYSDPMNFTGKFNNNEVRNLEIKYYEQELTQNDLEDLNLTSNNTNKTYGLQNIIRQTINGKDKIFKYKVEPVDNNSAKTSHSNNNGNFENNCSCGYMPPNSNPLNYINAFKQIIENKEVGYIVNALKGIEPNLVNLTVIDDQIMADVGIEKLIPIQLLGDGIRKVFSIIIFIYQLKDGVALLDEIDNGLHYKSMPVLWKTIIYMAETYNVQLFITTHNIDSIKALSKVLSKDCSDFQNYCNIYTLRKNVKGDTLAVRSSYEQLDYMINQEMELR